MSATVGLVFDTSVLRRRGVSWVYLRLDPFSEGSVSGFALATMKEKGRSEPESCRPTVDPVEPIADVAVGTRQSIIWSKILQAVGTVTQRHP